MADQKQPLRDGSSDDEQQTVDQLDQYYADKEAYEQELPENAQHKSSSIPPSDPRAMLPTDAEELLKRDRRERKS